MTIADNYTSATALSAYFPSVAGRATARLWANEKLVHDLGAIGFVGYFEGPGDDPTALDGYSASKLWLRQSAGVQSSSGTIRVWNGDSPASSVSNWPVLTPELYVDLLSRIAGGDLGLSAELSTYTPAGDDAVATTIRTKLREWVSVKDFGAVGDGVEDDTAAINAALAAHPGKTILLPEGEYKISGKLTVPAGTLLMGMGSVDSRYPGRQGATIYVTHTIGEAISLGRGASLRNFAMYWPDQTTGDEPTEYDWAIKFDVGSVSGDLGNGFGSVIENFTIHNCYKGIDFGGDAADGSPTTGQHVLHDVRMFAIHTAIHLGHTAVSLYVDKLDHSPVFWAASASQPIRSWPYDNGVAIFHIEGFQSPQIEQCTLLGHRRGLYYSNPDGVLGVNASTFLQVAGTIFDGLETCVEVADQMGLNEAVFTGCTFLAASSFASSSSSSSKVFHFNGSANANSLALVGCKLLGSTGSHIVGTFTGSGYLRLNISGTTFNNANRGDAGGTHYNINLDGSGGSLSAGWVNIGGGTSFYNPTAPSSVTCVKVNGFGQFIADGVVFKDTTSKFFELSSINQPMRIGAITGASSVASTFPTNVRSVAAAATVTLPDDSTEFFQVFGTTPIETITASWVGRPVTLYFAGSGASVVDGSNLKLDGNFTSTADGTLSLIMGGSGNWIEKGRT